MFDPYPVYAALGAACAGVPDFSVTPRLVVGTFSYAKLPMVADLAAQGDALADHDVVAALAGDPDALRAVRSELDRSRVALDDPERDAARARRRQQPAGGHRGGALRRRTSSCTGPPGTGKSQTIANLIATLAADGKRVLFVAEKRAAIDAVVGRLDRVGLGDLVLDLHAGAHGRRRVARELVDGLDRLARPEAGRATSATGPAAARVTAPAAARRTAADRLSAHVASLHEQRQPWGRDPVRGAGSRLGVRRPAGAAAARGCGCAVRCSPASTATRSQRRRPPSPPWRSLADWDADGADDPWFGAGIHTADEAAEARERVERLAGGAVDDTARTLAEVFRGIQLPEAPTAGDWGHVLATVGEVRDTLEVFRPEVFDIPLTDLVTATGERGLPPRGRRRPGLARPLAAAPAGPRPAAPRAPARRPARWPWPRRASSGWPGASSPAPAAGPRSRSSSTAPGPRTPTWSPTSPGSTRTCRVTRRPGPPPRWMP